MIKLTRAGLAWLLFGAGHFVSRLPWYPYRVYSVLMLWSDAIQGDGHGPWESHKHIYSRH